MKKIYIILLIMLFPLAFTACAEDEITPTETAGISINDIYTSVASTLSAAQASAVTLTPLPSSTPIPTNTSQPTLTPQTTTLLGINSVVYATASTCYNSAYVSDVTISDGTEMYPGESFTKTWKIRNSGTCTWPDDFTFVHVSGDDMDADDVTIDDDVVSGDNLSISVEMIAPDSEGTYYSYWAMADEDGETFGATIYVMIVVTDDASTSTPTSTYTSTSSSATSTSASYTATPTSVPTSTTAPTNTAAPTNTTEPTSTTAVEAGSEGG
jgi:hypothetical protein